MTWKSCWVTEHNRQRMLSLLLIGLISHRNFQRELLGSFMGYYDGVTKRLLDSKGSGDGVAISGFKSGMEYPHLASDLNYQIIYLSCCTWVLLFYQFMWNITPSLGCISSILYPVLHTNEAVISYEEKSTPPGFCCSFS